jgi:CheY-like chemotaxis protein
MGTLPRGSLRLLVIDDDRDNADTTGALVEALGHRARVVYDGSAALAAAQAEPADVVLLDLAMPGMDGLTLARRLRALPGMETALLVCVSGYGQDRDRDSARAAGYDVHLLKPAEPEELERLLADHAGRPGRQS